MHGPTACLSRIAGIRRPGARLGITADRGSHLDLARVHPLRTCMVETALHTGERQMPSDFLLPARSIALFLANILGPEVYDAPPFNRGNPYRGRAIRNVVGPLPDPWLEVALNPQPLPPRELYAIVLADAHIQEVVRLDQTVANFGEGFAEAGISKARLK